MNDVIINEDESYTFEIPLYDVDGELLSYEIIISDDASYELNNTSINIIPNLNFNGLIPVLINVTDNNSIVSDSFIINVLAVNDIPEITSTPPYDIFINELFEYSIDVYDPDNSEFIFSLEDEPLGMEIEGNIITWIPDLTGLFGPITILVTEVDSDNPQTGIQEFYVDIKLAQNFSFHAGNNLISYLGVAEDNSIENMLSPLSNNISQILTENSASVQLDDGSWIGSLNYILPTKGYWIRLDDDTEYGIATYQTSIDQVYNLHLGQNLISYIGPDNIDLDDALPNDVVEREP